MTDHTQPTATLYHERPQWLQETERGVLVRNSNVVPKSEDLLPRVVIRGDMALGMKHQHIVVGPIGSRDDYVTVTFKPTLVLTTGCFTGSLPDFERELSFKGVADTNRNEYLALVSFLKILETTR
jgi:hypothetical protein